MLRPTVISVRVTRFDKDGVTDNAYVVVFFRCHRYALTGSTRSTALALGGGIRQSNRCSHASADNGAIMQGWDVTKAVLNDNEF